MPVRTADDLARQLVPTLRGKHASWTTLLELAEAARPEERASLAPLVERAGLEDGKLGASCLVGVCRLHGTDSARDRLRAAIAATSDWTELGTLLAALPEAERARLLPEHLERALSLPDDDARWDACDALTMDLDDAEEKQWERWFGEACLRCFGRISDDPYRHLGDGPTPEQKALRLEQERARWGATFEAWRLGDDAAGLPEDQQGPAFDRAIDAFERLIPTPIDPGNDEGPFWAIARYLSLAQARRALSILGRMKARDWCYELAGSKAALLTRLAWLGQPDEALGVLRSIGHDGDFDAHWRATAWGGWVSGRLAHEPDLTLAQALRDAEAEDPRVLHDTEGRFRVLSELHYRFGSQRLPERAAKVAEACVGEVLALRERDLRLGRIALEECIGVWGKTLPLERWLGVIADEADGPARVELLEVLHEARPEALPTLLAELRRTPPPYPALMTKLLLEVEPPVPPEDVLPAWDAWMAVASAAGHVWLGTTQDLEGLLSRALIYLGGPSAPAVACRVLAEVSAESVRGEG